MTEHTGDAPTPESRSRELAAKATSGRWRAWLREDYDPDRFLSYRQKTVIGAGDLGHWAALSPDNDREDAAYIAFHDPSLITAYADVVEKVRSLITEGIPDGELGFGSALYGSIARLDSLAKDRG